MPARNDFHESDTVASVGGLLKIRPGATLIIESGAAVQGMEAAISAEIQAAAVESLTDSSGGAVADGTIAVVTAPTALTDNGGGTADGTVASLAAAVTLTDSTGDSGTHDDTLAAVTLPVALTVTDGAGTNDGTIGAITDNASTITAVQELAAMQNTTTTAVTVLRQNDSDLAQKVIELVAWQTTVQDNIKELTTAQVANRTAIVALTDAITELATTQNALLASMRTSGLLAT